MNRKPPTKNLHITIEGLPELTEVLTKGFSSINKKLDVITTSIAENGTAQQRQALADKLDALIKDVKSTIK